MVVLAKNTAERILVISEASPWNVPRLSLAQLEPSVWTLSHPTRSSTALRLLLHEEAQVARGDHSAWSSPS